MSEVAFPLYVFEKDDASMFLVESPERILYYFEPVDIEGGEYLFWDGNGKSVRVSVAGNCVSDIRYGEPAEAGLVQRKGMTLAEAFERHADAFHLNVDTSGTAAEVWHRFTKAEGRSSGRQG